MAQNWLINPIIKDYEIDKGSPVQTDSLKVPAYFRLKVKRTKWMYAPNINYGSDFYLEQKRKNNTDTERYENIADRALQQLLEDGRALSIETTVNSSSRQGLGMAITIEESSGNLEQFNFTSIGT